ncbi:MAG: sialidase family protein [Planctomycetota bacterium]
MDLTLENLSVVFVLALACCTASICADDVNWLIEYQADALPDPAQWTRQGGEAAKAEIADGVLRIAEETADDMCCYRAVWDAKPDQEIIVEARVQVKSVKAWRGGTTHWPWRDGSPISILVSDGLHQEGLSLIPGRVSTFMDRSYLMDTVKGFHVYRLVIRGTDMSVLVDGEMKIRGKDAFWKPALDGKPFIQFGSCSKSFMGESLWDYVRLGVRPAKPATQDESLKITIGEPWQILKPGIVRSTRPYLYDMGGGLLLMSVAQGPDKYYEPYGILKSTDQGKTWTPVEGLQKKTFVPQPMIRLADGAILGVSRWNVQYEEGKHVGMTFHMDPKAETFTMIENNIAAPKDTWKIMVLDRHIFDIGNNTILAVVYDSKQHARLLQTTDRGLTWKLFSNIGAGHEPAVARLSDTDMVAILRQGTMKPFHQVRSNDGGKTWSEPATLEEGSVDADLVWMSNGVLACSYGRPGSCIMFSTDKGMTWSHHRVITDVPGFNYTTIREIAPGRLLYIHDAPPLTALYIDVERLGP